MPRWLVVPMAFGFLCGCVSPTKDARTGESFTDEGWRLLTPRQIGFAPGHWNTARTTTVAGPDLLDGGHTAAERTDFAILDELNGTVRRTNGSLWAMTSFGLYRETGTVVVEKAGSKTETTYTIQWKAGCNPPWPALAERISWTYTCDSHAQYSDGRRFDAHDVTSMHVGPSQSMAVLGNPMPAWRIDWTRDDETGHHASSEWAVRGLCGNLTAKAVTWEGADGAGNLTALHCNM